MAGQESIWKNNLFLQMLGAAGQDISAGGPIGTNVNKAMKQNMQNENFRNYLASFLGPEGVPGGKATVSDKGADFHLPAEYIAEGGFDLLGGGEVMGGGTEGAFKTTFDEPTSALAPTKGGGPRPNPFASALANLSPSDMVGLTPELMLKGLEMGMGRETTAADLRYKEALIKQAEAVAEKTRRPGEVKEPTSIQEYRFAVAQGFDGSYVQYKEAKTVSMKDYEAAVKSGYDKPFWEWYMDVKKSEGGIDIGKAVERKVALNELKGQALFADPRWTELVDDHLASEAIQDRIDFAPGKGEEYSKNVIKIRLDAAKEKTQRLIKGGQGKIQSVRWGPGGRSIIWSVKWGPGRTQEIEYELEK